MFWISVIYARIRVAAVLWWARKSSGLSLKQAALKVGIRRTLLLKYELGLASPRLRSIGMLLTAYKANDRVRLFFCSFSSANTAAVKRDQLA